MTASKLPPAKVTSAFLREQCAAFDAFIWPKLLALGFITSGVSAIGIASQFQSPDFDDYVLAAVFGLALWLICSGFWYGAWLAPFMSYRKPQLLFAFVTVFGFASYAGMSVTANLTATAGEAANDLTQQRMIDRFDNAGVEMAVFVSDVRVLQAGISDRAQQAQRLQTLEADGGGPTGVAGTGSVFTAYGLSHGTYQTAADLLRNVLDDAETHIAAVQAAIAVLREAQADPALSGPEQEAQLKILGAKVLGEMRALLALNPAGAVRAAAASITRGVPPQSNTSSASRARIADISADMRRYAEALIAEADRLEANVPELPLQTTLSIAEQLWVTAASLPALVALALLLDISGFVFCGYRLSLYLNLWAKEAEEAELPYPAYILTSEIANVEYLLEHAFKARSRIERTRRPAKIYCPKAIKAQTTDEDGTESGDA